MFLFPFFSFFFLRLRVFGARCLGSFICVVLINTSRILRVAPLSALHRLSSAWLAPKTPRLNLPEMFLQKQTNKKIPEGSAALRSFHYPGNDEYTLISELSNVRACGLKRSRDVACHALPFQISEDNCHFLKHSKPISLCLRACNHKALLDS